MPAPTIHTTSRRISHATSRASAPIAMRIPISRVRLVTMYATTP